MFGKKKENQNSGPYVLTVADFEISLHDTFDKSSVPNISNADDEMDIIKGRIPTFDQQDKQYQYQIIQITEDYFKQRRKTQIAEVSVLEQVKQVKREEEVRIEKTDYIDEKSKLTEKQLLAEIVLLLENIRNDAKINSETMNQKLNTISSATLDSKYELEAQTQADKKHRKDNTGPSWEF
jgi:hypothetical protein